MKLYVESVHMACGHDLPDGSHCVVLLLLEEVKVLPHQHLLELLGHFELGLQMEAGMWRKGERLEAEMSREIK